MERNRRLSKYETLQGRLTRAFGKEVNQGEFKCGSCKEFVVSIVRISIRIDGIFNKD